MSASFVACMHRSTEPVARTGHDLAVREVACEEIIVGSDVFVADGVLLRLILHHPVQQEEREPAGKCSECST